MSACRAHRPGRGDRTCTHLDLDRIAARYEAPEGGVPTMDQLAAYAVSLGLAAQIHPVHGRVSIDVPGDPIPRHPVGFSEIDVLAERARRGGR